jgi:ribosome-binding ATPase YchF (GTP1/OBG family)
VQEALNRVVFKLLDNIVVYPVEDENRYTDHFNNVLPDAILMRKGSTALDLANAIHTEIGKNMLYAVDARTKRRLGKDYVLNENDVIRIVSAAK